MRSVVPVVDLFAGPGGLGEGFSAYRPDGRKHRAFRILLSVEKDIHAHQTLLLRAFYRQFAGGAPEPYYQYLRGELTDRDELFALFPSQARAARHEAMLRTLGEQNPEIHAAIEQRLARAGAVPWVLIGGPPCQAYSVAGRSRMQEAIATDDRLVLYQEYLNIIARFRPSVFVMENVKGILSSQVRLDEKARPHINGTQERIFHRILKDLKNPVQAAREVDPDWEPAGHLPNDAPRLYRIYSLVTARDNPDELRPSDYVIRAEEYEIPQMRHRVILLGVREDIAGAPCPLTRFGGEVDVEGVLRDLPPLRSQLSKRKDQERDSPEAWRRAVQQVLDAPWLENGLTAPQGAVQLELFDEKLRPDTADDFRDRITAAAHGAQWEASTGGRYMERLPRPVRMDGWFYDPRLAGVCNHESRSHMVSDLHRYLYLACYAEASRVSPTIRAFPAELLPEHENLKDRDEDEEDVFDDRFRVQVATKPATTITAHISKDGHYNIHPDPTQCRSLTVREAARIQTFPDNYFFEGSRTQQYKQVGNAVPPYLARQIARMVYELLNRQAQA